MKPIIDDIVADFSQLKKCFAYAKQFLGDGVCYHLIFKEWKPVRSLSQNSLMWVWNQEIADYVNEHGMEGTDVHVTSDDIHDHLVVEFWGLRVIMIDSIITNRRIETKKFTNDRMQQHLEKMEFWTGEKQIPLTQSHDYKLAMGSQ